MNRPVIIGATPEGRKELVGFTDGTRESAHDWRALLLDLKWRGLSVAPELAVADGALGFWKALGEVWPKTREQRCWVRKTANVLNKLPKSQHPKAKRALWAIWMAGDQSPGRDRDWRLHRDLRRQIRESRRMQSWLRKSAPSVDREFGGVVIDADADTTSIRADVVDAIGNGLAEFLVDEVMHIDVERATLLLIIAAGVLVFADLALFLGVDRDHRLAGGLDALRLAR